MFSSALILLVLTVAIDSATVTVHNIDEKLRILKPALKVTEDLFRVQNKDGCLEKLFCLLESDFPDTVRNPLKYYSHAFTNKMHDFDSVAFTKFSDEVQKYPKTVAVVDAIKLGQKSLNGQNCSNTYSACTADTASLLNTIRAFQASPISPIRSNKRSWGCFFSGLGCAVSGGACIYCSVSTPACLEACAEPSVHICGHFGSSCFGR